MIDNHGERHKWNGWRYGGAESIIFKPTKDGIRAFYVDWMGGEIADEGLSRIFTTLIHKKIITMKVLEMLAEHKYLDYYVFKKPGDNHRMKLEKELGVLGIDPSTIEKIKEVYNM